ncbi:MAG: hypothetical protein JJU02_06695 [Cryomorphaceae bacterium]|nr:hypothetical protein [Cryomorphaceae bacterium]
MKRLLFILVLLFVNLKVVLAQGIKKMPETPIEVNVPDEYKKYPAVILKRSFNNLTPYIYFYQAVLFNSAEAIQDFNVYKFKKYRYPKKCEARIIKPDGRIIHLEKNDIYVKVRNHKLVFNGLQEGDILEYFVKEAFNVHVSLYANLNVLFDEKYPILDFLIFDIFPRAKGDLWFFDENYFESPNKKEIRNIRPIPPMIREPFARNRANTLNIYYVGKFDATVPRQKDGKFKMDYLWKSRFKKFILYKSNNPIFDSISGTGVISLTGAATLSHPYKLIKEKNLEDDYEILLELGRYLRENFTVIYNSEQKSSGDGSGRKVVDYDDFLRSLYTLLKALNIETEICLTLDRFYGLTHKLNNQPPDNFKDVVLYFPKIDIYWEVLNLHNAPGMISSGLFEIPVGTIEDWKFVEKRFTFPEYLKSRSIRNLSINFSEDDINQVQFDFKRQDYGFDKNNITTFLHRVSTSGTSEQKEQFKDYLLGRGVDYQIEKSHWENENLAKLKLDEPSTYVASGKISPGFINDFGNNGFELPIGKFLGKQIDLRQVNIRYQDIDLGNPFEKTWVVRVKLNGKQVVNMEELESNQTLVIDDKVFGEVKSTAVIENDELVWTVEEKYFDYYLSKAHYMEFRKLVNHLADLNEVKVIMR